MLALLPSADQIHDENWANLVNIAGPAAPKMDADYPSQRLSQLCTRMGVPVIDMVHAFRDAAPSHSQRQRNEWQHHRGLGHFNPAENRLVADQIYSYLIDDSQALAKTGPQSERR